MAHSKFSPGLHASALVADLLLQVRQFGQVVVVVELAGEEAAADVARLLPVFHLLQACDVDRRAKDDALGRLRIANQALALHVMKKLRGQAVTGNVAVTACGQDGAVVGGDLLGGDLARGRQLLEQTLGGLTSDGVAEGAEGPFGLVQHTRLLRDGEGGQERGRESTLR